MKIDIDRLVPVPACLDSLRAATPTLETLAERMGQYQTLIGQWNEFASLMSRKEAEEGILGHIADSLSLVPVLAGLMQRDEARLVDIGSGGGFPAIPIAAALPELHITLVERSQRKAGFLMKVAGALGLANVQVRCEAYPSSRGNLGGNFYTARAVERPSEVVPRILKEMKVGEVFLNQTAVHAEEHGELFHVEPIADAWTWAGLRRGTLELIRRIR